ncbi:MAG: D-alanyl-D-alanine carboxypeptidase/D-alanyl-D-alanine-endopeptidase [Bacteroidales bacterium]
MRLKILVLIFSLLPVLSSAQKGSLLSLLSDPAMAHSSVSLCILNSVNGETVFEYNPDKSLAPASVLKLVTSAAALEVLGPGHTFRTTLCYTGALNRKTGRLTGNIVIKGGGDPSLGSENFRDHYCDFLNRWVTDIRNSGIKKVDGKIISDDSYFDFQPVPAKWLWEDAGNYYGAGAYGLSVFDNTYSIRFRLSEGSKPVISGISPPECKYVIDNYLVSEGTTDNGYVFAAPYSKQGWISGKIPAGNEDFVLGASIPDPPLLLAEILTNMLDSAGIAVTGKPSTTRLEKEQINDFKVISEILSPPLNEIIEVLNHESVNLYAEHLLKEMAKASGGKGTTEEGIAIVKSFLLGSGVNISGLFMEDGSGLSPLDAVPARVLSEVLYSMKHKGKFFTEYYASLPEAGNEGTLKSCFRDTVFQNNLRAKSGSMTRVRSYAGYFRTLSGKEMIFSIIVNNYSGPSVKIISGIEGILKEAIMNNQE